MKTFKEKKAFCAEILERGFRMSISEMNEIIEILSNHIDFNKIVKFNFLTLRINNVNELIKDEEVTLGFFIHLTDGTKHHIDYNFACMSKTAQENARKKITNNVKNTKPKNRNNKKS